MKHKFKFQISTERIIYLVKDNMTSENIINDFNNRFCITNKTPLQFKYCKSFQCLGVYNIQTSNIKLNEADYNLLFIKTNYFLNSNHRFKEYINKINNKEINGVFAIFETQPCKYWRG